MYPCEDSSTFHGMIRMPRPAVMSPPVRNEMRCGARFEKSLAGDTTFAARFVVSVATLSASMERRIVSGPPILPRSSTGSQTTPPPGKISAVADVNRHPDEREERHRGREPERLPHHLVPLRARIAREIRDVQRERGPVAHHRGERREEDRQELRARGET